MVFLPFFLKTIKCTLRQMYIEFIKTHGSWMQCLLRFVTCRLIMRSLGTRITRGFLFWTHLALQFIFAKPNPLLRSLFLPWYFTTALPVSMWRKPSNGEVHLKKKGQNCRSGGIGRTALCNKPARRNYILWLPQRLSWLQRNARAQLFHAF